MFLHTELGGVSGDGRKRSEVNVSDKATRFKVVPISKTTDKLLNIQKGAVCGGAKNAFFAPFSYSEHNILPRQARDKHNETLQKRGVFSQATTARSS
jgi:hypothetical protein